MYCFVCNNSAGPAGESSEHVTEVTAGLIAEAMAHGADKDVLLLALGLDSAVFEASQRVVVPMLVRFGHTVQLAAMEGEMKSLASSLRSIAQEKWGVLKQLADLEATLAALRAAGASTGQRESPHFAYTSTVKHWIISTLCI